MVILKTNTGKTKSTALG